MEEDFTRELMIRLSANASEADLLAALEAGIIAYKRIYNNNSYSERQRKEAFRRLVGTSCYLICIKATGMKPEDILKEIEQIERLQKLIQPNLG